jgi:hypothetical protein
MKGSHLCHEAHTEFWMLADKSYTITPPLSLLQTYMLSSEIASTQGFQNPAHQVDSDQAHHLHSSDQDALVHM